MTSARLPEPYGRYLRVLGIDGVPSGADGLRALVRRHLCRVPFENVSKLLLFERERAGRPVRLPEFLDGIEHRDLGGTCYSSNPFLAELLRALGYDAALLGADMSDPDVHTAIRVALGGREYHVDVGYAAPFYDPLPLDGVPVTIRNGLHRYVLDRAAEPGAYRLTMFVGETPRHGYLVHPPARSADFFARTIVDSFQPQKTFMRVLRVTRFFDSHTVEIRNRGVFVHRKDASEERVLSSLSDLRRTIDDQFLMPRCPIERAVAILEDLNGRDFFGESWADTM